ncbi:hypothetical protein BCR32DRAFT_330016 [Anaeromyces robustus]|uniref:Uncharacterized protein n=1 Tax=Anaeromyces robustus TaxID=1754192 RepID=A0A1Y1WIU1_9FUNG|nr:hypothetical protein BCR32DRAFT_330016 [Anaeromyces robustus]|eukprot:ORX73413.1 hypothetical protein BCR32DRAFT_330016 [Anaeromyces robustus]
MDNLPPPKYEHIMNMFNDNNSNNNNVKILTPQRVYEIPRNNFITVKDSIFGEAFIKNNLDEFKWSQEDEKIQEFIINFLESKGNIMPTNFSNDFIKNYNKFETALEKTGLYKYFENSSFGNHWTVVKNLKSYYNDVLCNEELCNKTCSLYFRAFNEALKSNIYEGDFEITSRGKIALNGKDITRRIISENEEEAVDSNNILINFCLYCDIDTYWNKILEGIKNMLFLNSSSIYNNVNLLEKEKVCHLKDSKCCYQSTFHRHIKFNLVPYINYLMSNLDI